MEPVEVTKNTTVILPVSLGFDVSARVVTSVIREGLTSDTPLIASWVVTYESDGVDGEVILTLEDTITNAITQNSGYMTLEVDTIDAFSEPLDVIFLTP